MFSTDFRCFHFQNWDQTEGIGQTGQESQVINPDFPNVHLFPYMDVKGACHAQPWPSLWVSWSALTLWLSIYGILRGVSCTYTLKDQIIVAKPWKCMEISIHTSNKSGQLGEYNFCGLEYYLCPYK